MSDIAKRLSEPFDPALVSWRVGPTNQDKSKGMALAYIDARDVMRRLDEVCGPENWQDEYPWSDGKRVVCRIGIKIDGEWIWKTDGAGDTDTEGEKGALSDAFKRAAVKWSVGRYLYDTETPWVEIEQKGKSYIIKKPEYARLRALLSGKEKPQQSWNQADREPAPSPLVLARDRIHKAIAEANLPTVIDDIIKVNTADLAQIKQVGPKTYEALMSFANGRKNEMRAAA